MAAADFSPATLPATSSQSLQNRLQLLSRARQKQLLVSSLVRGLLPAVAVSSVGVALYKLHIIPDAPIWLPLVPLAGGVLWALREVRLQSRGDFVAALEADAKLGQSDRLSSALSFIDPAKSGRFVAPEAPKTWPEKLQRAVFGAPPVLNHSVSSPATNLVPALVEEAANRAQKLEPKQIYPFRFDRRAQTLAGLSLVFLALIFAPDYPILLSAKEQKERAAMMKEGEKLVALSKTIREQKTPPPPAVEELNKRLQKLGQKMVRGRMTKRAALTDIGELKKQLQKASNPKGQSQAQSAGLPQIPEAVKQAPLQSKIGRDVQRDLLNGKAEEAAKKLEDLADKLDKGQLSQKEKEDAAKDLEKIAGALRERGGAANEQAARQLEQAAKALRQPQSQNGNQQQNQGDGQQNQGQNGPNQNQQGQNEGQNQQGQQGGQQQQQGGQQSQNQQNQSGQSQSKQGQNGQQGGQNQQGQSQQQQPGQNGQQGQNPQGQGQQNQSGQGQNPQNQQGQGQSQQGAQGQQGQQKGGSSSQSQGSQGQQGGGGKQGQSQQGGGQNPGGQSGQQGNGAGDALRDMANGLRQGSGSGGGGNLGEMLDKLREAENGTNGGSQFGMGKPSDRSAEFGGNCPGGDCRGLVTPGKDLKPTSGRGNNRGGPGLGPRDQSTGNRGAGISNMKSKRTGDTRRYADVWSDRLPKTRQRIDKIKGKWGGSGEVEQLPTRGEGKGGQASTPYYDVYESYKKDAEDAVGREAVPPAYKDSVKDYFESIKP